MSNNIKEQIKLELTTIYKKLYKSMIDNRWMDCSCGCEYNPTFDKSKNNYNLIVEGNIELIYNEVLKSDKKYFNNVNKNMKKDMTQYLYKLKNFINNKNYLFGLSRFGAKVNLWDPSHQHLIIIKEAGITKCPIIIHKYDEFYLRNKGLIGKVIKECLTAKILFISNDINKIYNDVKTIRNYKVGINRKRKFDDITNDDQVIISNCNKYYTESKESEIFKSLIDTFIPSCCCNCLYNDDKYKYKEEVHGIILVEGYLKKICDTVKIDNPQYRFHSKEIYLELNDIKYYHLPYILFNDYDNTIDICSHTIDRYIDIDVDIIPIIIDIENEHKLREKGLIGNVIKDSKCLQILLKKRTTYLNKMIK